MSIRAYKPKYSDYAENSEVEIIARGLETITGSTPVIVISRDGSPNGHIVENPLTMKSEYCSSLSHAVQVAERILRQSQIGQKRVPDICIFSKKSILPANSAGRKLMNKYNVRLWIERHEFSCPKHGKLSAEIRRHSTYSHTVRIYKNEIEVRVAHRGTLDNAFNYVEAFFKETSGAVYDKNKGFSVPS